MNNIGAIIITFNPEIETLKRNFKTSTDQVERVVVIDNGSMNLDEIRTLAQEFNVELIELGTNLGIAAAQNVGVQHLSATCDWVLLLDQDSVVPAGMIDAYIHSEHFGDESTGILSAQYVDRNWTQAERAQQIKSVTGETAMKRVIASGNLVKISAWQAVGKFDEWLFIDCVDFDFDYRLLLAGYHIWQVNQVLMAHAIGKVLHKPKLAKFLGYHPDQIISDHSAFRAYYIQRNTIVLEKRYPEFRRNRPETFSAIYQLRRVLLYDAPRGKKFVASVHGIWDGIRYQPQQDSFVQTFRSQLK